MHTVSNCAMLCVPGSHRAPHRKHGSPFVDPVRRRGALLVAAMAAVFAVVCMVRTTAAFASAASAKSTSSRASASMFVPSRGHVSSLHASRKTAVKTGGIVGFGKYSGDTFDAVFAKDPDYCTWVARLRYEDDTSPMMREFGDYVIDKNPDVLDAGADLSDTVGFGKHRAKAFGYVLAEDRDYCRWVVQQAAEPDCTPAMRSFADYLLMKAPGLINEAQSGPSGVDGVVGFGKHRGKSFAAVLAEDRDYCIWVATEATDPEANSMMRAFADYLSNEAPGLINEAQSGPSGEDGVVGFGKHRGKSFEAVLAEDRDYCRWVATEATDPEASSMMRVFADYLSNEAPGLINEAQSDEDGVVRFGKHRGKSFAAVLAEDRDYCIWVAQTAKDPEASSIMRVFADYLSNEAPGLINEAQSGEDGVVGFGKHRGKSFAAVLAEDRDYCIWVAETAKDPEASSMMRAFAGFLSSAAPELGA